jgi:quinol monooxygenase YgiN
LNVKSNQIENQIKQLNQILQNYRQVPACSSYYVDAELKIPQVQAYLEQLKPMTDQKIAKEPRN